MSLVREVLGVKKDMKVLYCILLPLVVGQSSLSPDFSTHLFTNDGPITLHSAIEHVAQQLQKSLGFQETKSQALKNPLESYIQNEAQDVLKEILVMLSSTDSEMTLRLFGSLLPIFNVSMGCSEASWTILHQTINSTDSTNPWFLSFIDATGKLPDGMFANTLNLCNHLKKIQIYTNGITCEVVSSWFASSVGLSEEALTLILSSISFPYGNTNALGSFEECIAAKSDMNDTVNPPFKIPDFIGSYVPLKMSAVQSEGKEAHNERMAGGISIIGGSLPISLENGLVSTIIGFMIGLVNVQYAMCVPNTCSLEDVSMSNALLFQDLSLKTERAVEGGPDLLNEDNLREDIDQFAKAMIGIFSFLAFLILFGTLIEVWSEVNPFPILPKTDKDSNNLVMKIFKSFSILSNGKEVLSTETNKNHITCLGGIRTISMFWIIYGHLYLVGEFLFFQGFVINKKEMEDIIYGQGSWMYQLVLNALPAVDTFFFMSGLLSAYISFSQLDKKQFNLGLFYLHRYLRLTIPMAFVIAFETGFVQFMSYGPIYQSVPSDLSKVCKDFGWRNFLYIQNFFKTEEMCLGQTWYLAVDMQLYLLSPIIIYPLWKWTKVGLALSGAVYVIFTSLIGYLVLHNELPLTTSFISNSIPNDFDYEKDFYNASYVRFQPFLIGILVAYGLYKTKGQEVKIPKVWNLILWQLSLITMFAIVFGPASRMREDNLNSHTWTPFESMVYNCFHKTLWSLALGWIVFSCHKGYGGVLNDFLSWECWVPLAKLSFGAYLNHITVQVIVFYSISSPLYLTDFVMSQFFIGITCFTFGTAFVQALTAEVPFVNLEKILLGGMTKPKQEMQDNAKELNGQNGKQIPKEKSF